MKNALLGLLFLVAEGSTNFAQEHVGQMWTESMFQNWCSRPL